MQTIEVKKYIQNGLIVKEKLLYCAKYYYIKLKSKYALALFEVIIICFKAEVGSFLCAIKQKFHNNL